MYISKFFINLFFLINIVESCVYAAASRTPFGLYNRNIRKKVDNVFQNSKSINFTNSF